MGRPLSGKAPGGHPELIHHPPPEPRRTRGKVIIHFTPKAKRMKGVKEMANNELAGAFIQIVSGEGEQGTVETYTGDKTEKAIIAQLIKEGCNGDRWAFARIDGVRYDRKGDTLEPRY